MSNSSQSTKDIYTVLVTGVNSGLGFGICCRLIDEFFLTRPQSQSLNLIFTTRDRAKSDATLLRLRIYLQKALRRADKAQSGISKLLEPRIGLQPEIIDLTSFSTIRRLAQKLLLQDVHVDILIHNAGISGVSHVDWLGAGYQFFMDFSNFGSYPEYLVGRVGWRTAKQVEDATALKTMKKTAAEEEPPLGMVFTANVFGPYMLTRQLMPLLVGGDSPSRVIWVGSLDGFPKDFSFDDFQAIDSAHAYSASKRLVDLLTLTYNLPSTRPYVSQFFSLSNVPHESSTGDQFVQKSHPQPTTTATTPTTSTIETQPIPQSTRPKLYIAHPGILQTNVVPLVWPLPYFQILALFFFRTIGDMWQTVWPYFGATSIVWLALADHALLNDMEAREGVAKWGSAVDWQGRERVERTEVEGWGIGGKVGDADVGTGKRRKGTWVRMKVTTKEVREEFEEDARRCWKEMERLRMEWEDRMDWNGA